MKKQKTRVLIFFGTWVIFAILCAIFIPNCFNLPFQLGILTGVCITALQYYFLIKPLNDRLFEDLRKLISRGNE